MQPGMELLAYKIVIMKRKRMDDCPLKFWGRTGVLHLDFRTDAIKKTNETSTGCSFLLLAVNIAEFGNALYFQIPSYCFSSYCGFKGLTLGIQVWRCVEILKQWEYILL